LGGGAARANSPSLFFFNLKILRWLCLGVSEPASSGLTNEAASEDADLRTAAIVPWVASQVMKAARVKHVVGPLKAFFGGAMYKHSKRQLQVSLQPCILNPKPYILNLTS